MAKATYKIVWTDEAKEDLKNIYDRIKKVSPKGAKNVIADIRKKPKSVHFPKQNRVDLYNEKYMRLIVRHFKILYSINEEKRELVIHSVFDTDQDPIKLKEL